MLRNKIIFALFFFLSALIVGWGQPARIGVFGSIAAACGYALFFYALSYGTQRGSRRFWKGVLWFSCVQLLQLSWMTSIEFQGYYILFVYVIVCFLMGLQFGLLTLLVPSQGKLSGYKILQLASFWTVMEWVRLYFFCGFSWNPVGLALSCYLPPMQFASVFGVFGLSFWVMLGNFCGLNVLRRGQSLVFFLVIICVPYLFGLISLKGTDLKSVKGIDVALVQTNLSPSEKVFSPSRPLDYVPAFFQWAKVIDYLKQTKRAHWDLIVLPEAAVPYGADQAHYLFDQVRDFFIHSYGMKVMEFFPPLQFPYAEKRGKALCVSNLFWCHTLANLYKSELIIGLDCKVEDKNFNAAFYFQPGGLGYSRYEKQILLPLAESLPFAALKPLTKNYGIESFFSPGKGPKLFGKTVRYAPSICYEETFSEKMRKAQLEGADLFVNLSNDNYFPDSLLAQQHFDLARLRAVENGIALLRSCNQGKTGVVDCLGQILFPFDATNGIEGVLSAHLPIQKKQTLFSLWGDAGIIFLCAGFLGVSLLFQIWRALRASPCKAEEKTM